MLRDDFDDESDIDLLVEFDPAYKVDFIRLAAMELELGAILQRKVDIRTLAEIHNAFRLDNAMFGYTQMQSTSSSHMPRRSV